MSEKSYLKNYKNLIYIGDTVEISTERTSASLQYLTTILRDRPLRRKDVTQRTGWTRGQLAGLLYRGMKRGLFKLKDREISLVKKE